LLPQLGVDRERCFGATCGGHDHCVLPISGVAGHEDGIDSGPRAFPRGDCPAPGERASQLRGEIGLRRAAVLNEETGEADR
jgi:hypothetical protein